MPPHESAMDPATWLATALDHLATVENTDVPVRIRCFCGQRAVELSVKAVLIHRGIEFPFTHTLERLVALLPVDDADAVPQVGALTPYAVEEMYPDTFTEVTIDHAQEAATLARTVVEWATSIVGP